MAAARLKQSLAGAADQRSAAYTELTALANGDAADATTGLSNATLRIGGLADAGLEDEAQLWRYQKRGGKASWPFLLVFSLPSVPRWAMTAFTSALGSPVRSTCLMRSMTSR